MKSLLNRFAGKASGHSSDISRDNWFRLLALAGLCLGLVACGGGGGGSSITLSVLNVSIQDNIYHSPVQGVQVTATVNGTQNYHTATTDASGKVQLIFSNITGTESIYVELCKPQDACSTTFNYYQAPSSITANQATDLPVTLVRKTSPAGGSLTSRDPNYANVNGVVNNNGTTMTFQIELVIVDGNSNPVTGLETNPANFTLLNCDPSVSNCISGNGAANVAYTATTANPSNIVVTTANPALPYDTALMMDQSGSISTSDPTGARLYSAKAFLAGLGTNDSALLAAFASNPGALIPNPPLTIYPQANPAFQSSTTASTTYYPLLDSLSNEVGGKTPLYDSLDTLINNWSIYSTSGNARAVVIFTDGTDTSSTRTLNDVIAAANTANPKVNIFTIGLSTGVDFNSLGTLANQTGGVFLFASSPQQLIPLYGSVGNLLSLSLPTYRLTFTITANSSGAFVKGSELFGQVQVNGGGSTFDVPFIVGIP
jgi:hypothetical protein